MRNKSKPETLGIIPARFNSKEVPGKNLRLLKNKPLIVYTIEAAQKARKLDRLIVTTENARIAEIGKEAGADVPFRRPLELAEDDIPDNPVYLHAINWLIEHRNYYSDFVVILRPTTPFKTPQIIDEAIQMMIDTGADSVRTVTCVEGVHHPYWMFKKDTDNRAEPFISGVTLEKYYQRQLLPPVYRLNGVVDVIKTEVVLNHPKLYGDDMRLLEIPAQNAVDIDSELDFKICEAILNK